MLEFPDCFKLGAVIGPPATRSCQREERTNSGRQSYPNYVLYLPRSKKDGTATRVDAICTYHPDIKGHRLDREQLYWELNGLTHGVTRLDPYTLDRDSLYVNGEHLDVDGVSS